MEQNILHNNGLLQMQEEHSKAKAFMENKWHGATQTFFFKAHNADPVKMVCYSKSLM